MVVVAGVGSEDISMNLNETDSAQTSDLANLIFSFFIVLITKKE